MVVRIQRKKQNLELEVSDNGCGFNPRDVRNKGGIGLDTMRERAQQINGKLTINATPGTGTIVIIRVSDVEMGVDK